MRNTCQLSLVCVFVWLLRAQSLGVSHSSITQILSKTQDTIVQEILYLYYYNAPVGNMKVWNLRRKPYFWYRTVKSKFVGYFFDDKVLWLLLVLSNGLCFDFKERWYCVLKRILFHNNFFRLSILRSIPTAADTLNTSV